MAARKSTSPPPAPTTVDEFEMHGRTWTKGDQITVLPSAPRHRDGFVARVIGARVVEGAVVEVDVFGAAGSKAPLTRTLRPERLAPVTGRNRKKRTAPEEEAP